MYDLDLLHKFAKTFPESPLTDFIDDYCRWFKLPLPEPEEEVDGEAISEEKAKEKNTNKKEKFQRWRKKSKGPNARERRKDRRQAGKEGVLAEDLDQEEREELISSMAVSSAHPRVIGLDTDISEITRSSQDIYLRSSGHV